MTLRRLAYGLIVGFVDDDSLMDSSCARGDGIMEEKRGTRRGTVVTIHVPDYEITYKSMTLS